MKLLVITPTLGRSRWIAETIMSVRHFAPGAQHVLVGPKAVMPELTRRYPKVSCCAEPDREGMYSAINRGASTAAGWDAITYLNDDDILLPRFACAVGATANGAELAYGGVRLIDAKGTRVGAIAVSRQPRHNRALYAQRIEPVAQQGAVMTRTLWERLGGFSPSYRCCGDSELLARACLLGVRTRYVGGEVAAFRLRPGQMSKNRMQMDEERQRMDVELGLLQRSGVREFWARVVFRLSNAGVYAERIARHGFLSYDAVLSRLG